MGPGRQHRHPPNAFNDNSDDDIINPFTANDATLMNVLGYNFTNAPTSPIPLPSTDITLSAGQLLEDLTLNEMNPGSVNPPAGDSYVVIDTAFDLESITAAEITQAIRSASANSSPTASLPFCKALTPPTIRSRRWAATPFIAVLTVAQALAD